jgi:predicted dehydrogenase
MPSQTEDDPALRTSTAGSSSMKARVLVVGCGRMGQIRAALARANPRFDLCGVVDHDIEKAQGIADQVDVSD